MMALVLRVSIVTSSDSRNKTTLCKQLLKRRSKKRKNPKNNACNLNLVGPGVVPYIQRKLHCSLIINGLYVNVNRYKIWTFNEQDQSYGIINQLGIFKYGNSPVAGGNPLKQHGFGS